MAVKATKPDLLKYISLLKVLEDKEIVDSTENEHKRILENEKFSNHNDAGQLAGESDHEVDQRVSLVRERAWQLSILPVKSLFMNVLMIYMMGSGGIFGFIVLGYAVVSATRVLLAGGRSFDDLQASVSVPVNLLFQRIVYVTLAGVLLGYFVLQCGKSGLLPFREVHVGRLPSIMDNEDMLAYTLYL